MSDRTVRIAWLGPEAVEPTRVAEALAWLDAGERDRHDRLVRDDDRLNFARGRWLLRRMLSDATGTRPTDWRFRPGAHGRPEPLGPVDTAHLSVNLSHTRRMVVAALSTAAPVGVDVEYDDRPAPVHIARRFFAPDECAALDALAEPARSELFWRIWTLKEAWLKARGTGIAGFLASSSVRFADPAPPELVSAEGPARLVEVAGPARARIAVCTLGPAVPHLTLASEIGSP